MAKAWSLKYFSTRLRLACEEGLAQLQTASGSLPVAVQKGMETFDKQLTSVIYITGAAMAPALNSKASSDPSAVEKLLVRLIPRPSERCLSVGDVVAHQSPLIHAAQAEQQQVMVRRIAALPGDDMVSNSQEDEAWQVASGQCWVLADNEEMRPPDVIDSRTFGPLPMENILGRIIYQSQSAVEHGRVQNSEDAAEEDAAVLAAELDVETFVSGPDGGSRD